MFVLQFFIISLISLGAQNIVGYCQFWPQLSPESLVQKTFVPVSTSYFSGWPVLCCVCQT